MSVFIWEAYVFSTSKYMCYISNLAGPKAHNIIHVNRIKPH